jgi:hypothetical protein
METISAPLRSAIYPVNYAQHADMIPARGFGETGNQTICGESGSSRALGPNRPAAPSDSLEQRLEILAVPWRIPEAMQSQTQYLKLPDEVLTEGCPTVRLQN